MTKTTPRPRCTLNYSTHKGTNLEKSNKLHEIQPTNFQVELSKLISAYKQDDASQTPDYILAYLCERVIWLFVVTFAEMSYFRSRDISVLDSVLSGPDKKFVRDVAGLIEREALTIGFIPDQYLALFISRVLRLVNGTINQRSEWYSKEP